MNTHACYDVFHFTMHVGDLTPLEESGLCTPCTNGEDEW